MLFYVSLALGIISCIVFLVKRVKKGGIDALLMKALTSTFFIACSLTAAFKVLSADKIGFALFVIMGLVMGLMGDIWLDLKWMDKENGDKYTFAGFGAFMIGHFAFIAGLLKYFGDFSKYVYILGAAGLALLLAIGVLVLEKPMKMKYGKFRAITGVYGFVLAFMTFLSGALALMNSFSVMTLNFMFVGGVLFLISDLILSGTYFGVGKDRPVDIITNHVSYFAAQYVIAASILFLGEKIY